MIDRQAACAGRGIGTRSAMPSRSFPWSIAVEGTAVEFPAITERQRDGEVLRDPATISLGPGRNDLLCRHPRRSGAGVGRAAYPRSDQLPHAARPLDHLAGAAERAGLPIPRLNAMEPAASQRVSKISMDQANSAPLAPAGGAFCAPCKARPAALCRTNCRA